MQPDSQYTNERNYPPECLTSVQYSETSMLFLKPCISERATQQQLTDFYSLFYN